MKLELYNFTLYDPTMGVSIQMDLSNYVHDKSTGLGIPEVTRFTEQGPQQHGATDRGFLLTQRILTFKVLLRATTPTLFYTRRQDLYKVLRPAMSNVGSVLRVTLPDATKWDLTVFLTKPPIFSPLDSLNQEVEFTLIAPNPVWSQYVTATLVTFYQADIPSSKITAYTGEWIAYPYPVSITGLITHPIITNLTTGAKIDINYTIPDNITIFIDLHYGYKTVSSGCLQYLSADSDLDSFYLLPDPDAANGNNTIKVEGTSMNAHTRVQLGWIPVRLGL